jgi:uncharacterized protein
MDPEIIIIAPDTGGDIAKNQDLMEHISPGKITKGLIEAAKKGTPLLRQGSGSPHVLMIAGIHGNELPPQATILKVLNELDKLEIKGTVSTIPFAIPYATMNKSRRFKGWDMNRNAFKEGYISNTIIKATQKLKIDAVADFHSTQVQSNPGRESVFCSKKPCYQSFEIANYIVSKTSSEIITHEQAGNLYKGAMEDEYNLSGTPAVTCEVVSRNGRVDPGSMERSYKQIKSYLEYFNII